MHSTDSIKKLLLFLILFICLGNVASLHAETNNTLQPNEESITDSIQISYKPSKNPTGALFRSMVIPGWGQAYSGHWFKALAFFGTDVGMVYGIYTQNRIYKENLDKASFQKTEDLRLEYERIADFYKSDRNKLIWWTAGFTLLCMFDAYVEAHLYDFKIDPELSYKPDNNSYSAGIRLTIPLK